MSSILYLRIYNKPKCNNLLTYKQSPVLTLLSGVWPRYSTTRLGSYLLSSVHFIRHLQQTNAQILRGNDVSPKNGISIRAASNKTSPCPLVEFLWRKGVDFGRNCVDVRPL
ncbi:hypothetical protein TNIN_361241 [Trichonephila inaurata madagascariensis]|uniref:Uncharacterized protein n=1 Tax=Trichonephila inaurata madagascariensis TaxID=2747483 RepID=A0A8X6X628_9ARAC|nr:hypothetical protein TNIN_361241 [Trichonephila inaurata madagascariensis]